MKIVSETLHVVHLSRRLFMRVSIFLHSWTPPVLWERYWHSSQARWKPVNSDRVRKKRWKEKRGDGMTSTTSGSPHFSVLQVVEGLTFHICTTNTHTNLLCGMLLSWSTIFPSPSTSYPVAASEIGLDGGSRQVKEAVFLQQVRQAAAEERANQLRWWGNSQYYTWLGNQMPPPLCPWMKFFK